MASHARYLGRGAGLALALLAALALAGRCGEPPPVEPDPDLPPPVDAGLTVAEQCAAACARMRAIAEVEACPGFDGAPSPDGASCESVCVDVEQSGTARFCPAELASARSCAELRVTWEACE